MNSASNSEAEGNDVTGNFQRLMSFMPRFNYFSPVVNLDSLLFSHLTQEPDFTPCPILIHVVIVIPSILGCEILLDVDYHPVS